MQLNQPPLKAYVRLTQCDKKAYYFIDEKELDYEKSSIAEMAAQERDLLIGRADQGEIIITYSSVDMGGRRQICSYEARHIATAITFDPSEDAGIQPARINLDGWYIDRPGWDRCEDWPGTLAWAIELAPNPRNPLFILRWHGPRRGFIVEETSRVTGRVQIEHDVASVGIEEDLINRSLYQYGRVISRGHSAIRGLLSRLTKSLALKFRLRSRNSSSKCFVAGSLFVEFGIDQSSHRLRETFQFLQFQIAAQEVACEQWRGVANNGYEEDY